MSDYMAAKADDQITAAQLNREQLETALRDARMALLDANGMCRSAYQIARRIATEFSTHEMGTAFGPFADRLYESLVRQHAEILSFDGYTNPAYAMLAAIAGPVTVCVCDLVEKEQFPVPVCGEYLKAYSGLWCIHCGHSEGCHKPSTMEQT